MLGYLIAPDTMVPSAGEVLAALAARLEAEGAALAGAVQIKTRALADAACDVDLRVLGIDEPPRRITQSLGPGASGCRLDTGALAEAAGRAASVLGRGTDLVIVNKFGKVEAAGGGFRDLIAAALADDIPVLTAVAPEMLDDFGAFSGDLAEAVATEALDDWCHAALLSRAEVEIDARHLLCPLPVLRLRKRLAALEPGTRVRLVATDPAAVIDVPHFCAQAGHRLVGTAPAAGGARSFVVTRG